MQGANLVMCVADHILHHRGKNQETFPSTRQIAGLEQQPCLASLPALAEECSSAGTVLVASDPRLISNRATSRGVHVVVGPIFVRKEATILRCLRQQGQIRKQELYQAGQPGKCGGSPFGDSRAHASVGVSCLALKLACLCGADADDPQDAARDTARGIDCSGELLVCALGHALGCWGGFFASWNEPSQCLSHR